jgi:proline iminopeptidase
VVDLGGHDEQVSARWGRAPWLHSAACGNAEGGRQALVSLPARLVRAAVACRLFPDPDYISTFAGDEFSLSFARIECHYFVNGGFFKADDQLIADVGKIRHIPAVIVQGRYDLVCPYVTAFDLHRAWPEAEFVTIADAGHSAYEPGIQSALLDATDRFRG